MVYIYVSGAEWPLIDFHRFQDVDYVSRVGHVWQARTRLFPGPDLCEKAHAQISHTGNHWIYRDDLLSSQDSYCLRSACFFFRISWFLGWRVRCALVYRTLALDLPRTWDTFAIIFLLSLSHDLWPHRLYLCTVGWRRRTDARCTSDVVPQEALFNWKTTTTVDRNFQT